MLLWHGVGVLEGGEVGWVAPDVRNLAAVGWEGVVCVCGISLFQMRVSNGCVELLPKLVFCFGLVK